MEYIIKIDLYKHKYNGQKQLWDQTQVPVGELTPRLAGESCHRLGSLEAGAEKELGVLDVC